MNVPLSSGEIAQLACLLEVSARKPGNVHRFADFEDLSYVDLVLGASALVAPLTWTRACGVGPTILAAVEETRRFVATNPNLGIILLLTPLAAVPHAVPLRAGLRQVLEGLTMADAHTAYEAIRLAHPAGLGIVPDQDIATEPTVTLREAMRLAARRDLVARQYDNIYAEVFELALPALRDALAAGFPLEHAIVACFLKILADHPDSLITRKRGLELASEASKRARACFSTGTFDPLSPQLTEFDHWLREDGHARNPGTTADLVAATLYVALRDALIPLPLPRGSFRS